MLYSQVGEIKHLRKNKKGNITETDDTIEVMLRDNNLIPFFKQTARVNNKKQIAFLLAMLKAKGVNLGKIAKDVSIEWLK